MHTRGSYFSYIERFSEKYFSVFFRNPENIVDYLL